MALGFSKNYIPVLDINQLPTACFYGLDYCQSFKQNDARTVQTQMQKNHTNRAGLPEHQ